MLHTNKRLSAVSSVPAGEDTPQSLESSICDLLRDYVLAQIQPAPDPDLHVAASRMRLRQIKDAVRERLRPVIKSALKIILPEGFPG